MGAAAMWEMGLYNDHSVYVVVERLSSDADNHAFNINWEIPIGTRLRFRAPGWDGFKTPVHILAINEENGTVLADVFPLAIEDVFHIGKSHHVPLPSYTILEEKQAETFFSGVPLEDICA